MQCIDRRGYKFCLIYRLNSGSFGGGSGGVFNHGVHSGTWLGFGGGAGGGGVGGFSEAIITYVYKSPTAILVC